jgi:nuclear pore complex protein Nup98-Nup96
LGVRLADFDASDLTSLSSLRDIPGGIVKFAPREVQLYPAGDSPPHGEGLNVPAVISLEASWPKDRSTQTAERTTDPEKLSKHVQQLKKRCGKLGATFIDFDQETGLWTFRVESL